ncbi:sterol desaturase family protein [Brevundimonas sp.]|jgi:sterol desaturase/sphingolipid hydroxylase (fatty acid hydroxylase superfamily)|uniref:sterol desaturase family protein n=1 Tax=Brevundimonas sp. TaxID=1871086 RepID=UPI002E140F1D|nr:sterol desaturase family protein [Brevundimonas sp.]
MALLVYFVTFAAFVVVFTREVVAPASGASCDKRWRLYAGGLNAANLVVVVAAGFLFEGRISGSSLLGLSSKVDAVTGAVLTFLVSSFVAYWWHRLIHKSDRLWRWTHQLHHSPSRIEALTAFYVHPFDALAATLLNALVAYGLLGVGGLSAGLSLVGVTLFNLIAHADQRTPWWLGFLTQRPEMHRLHHERGAHRNNYGLPLWDLMLGTWRNPREGRVECGFAPEKESQIGPMLMCRDVDG